MKQAETIGGVRRVLKPSSEGFEVVELPNTSQAVEDVISTTSTRPESTSQPQNENSAEKNRETRKTNEDIYQPHLGKGTELQAERDLIAELLKVEGYLIFDSRMHEKKTPFTPI